MYNGWFVPETAAESDTDEISDCNYAECQEMLGKINHVHIKDSACCKWCGGLTKIWYARPCAFRVPAMYDPFCDMGCFTSYHG